MDLHLTRLALALLVMFGALSASAVHGLAQHAAGLASGVSLQAGSAPGGESDAGGSCAECFAAGRLRVSLASSPPAAGAVAVDAPLAEASATASPRPAARSSAPARAPPSASFA